MAHQLPEFRCIILVSAGQFGSSIRNGFLFLILYEINICNIVGNDIIIFRIILNDRKSSICISIFFLIKADISVIIICVNIVSVPGKLSNGIEKWFGEIEILLDKVSIPFMEFQIGNFIIVQVVNA